MPFQKIRSTAIPSLNASIDEYIDSTTGAIHVHLADNSAEMCFMVALPTVPTSDNGAAHVLEHVALCGSKKYPVRDPFFSMLKRSTSTFMNAITAPDRTMYPFSTLDTVDFYNLIDVYLDAVFFPNLDYFDFLQEGWRYGLTEGDLSHQGIVLNEIKDLSGDPVHLTIDGIKKSLMDGTPYQFDAGGSSAEITNLTHEELVAFHRKHYSANQAVFMSSGLVDVDRLQIAIVEKIPPRASNCEKRPTPNVAPPWATPKEITFEVPHYDESEERFAYVVAWRVGESRCAYDAGCANLLEMGLFGNASAPIQRAIEAAGFGYPSAVNGLSMQMKEMVLHVGMEGLTVDQVPEAKAVIWNGLLEAANEGIPVQQLRNVLRNIRFHQRYAEPQDLPIGLDRLSEALPYVLEGRSAADAFNYDTVLLRLDREIEDPDFFKSLVRTLTLNRNRVDATIVGNPDFLSEVETKEHDRIRSIERGMSVTDRERIQSESALLLDKQRSQISLDVLPTIRPKDVSQNSRVLHEKPSSDNGVAVANIGATGIVRAAITYDVSQLGRQHWQWLSLYTMLVAQLGVAEMSFEAAAEWREAMAPSFNVYFEATQSVESGASLDVTVGFTAEGLEEDSALLSQVLLRSARETRLDEEERIFYSIAALINSSSQSISAEGENFAQSYAAAPLSLVKAFEDITDGVRSLDFWAHLGEAMMTTEGRQSVLKNLVDVKGLLMRSKATVLLIGGAKATSILAPLLTDAVQAGQHRESDLPDAGDIFPKSNHLLYAPAQVNHCEAVWSVPKIGHALSGALEVLAHLITNDFLHRVVREEGGAYHAGAVYDYVNGLFTMSSERDPNVASTFSAFAASVDWAKTAPITDESIDQAIICSVKKLDRPLTVFQEVTEAIRFSRLGINARMQQEFRTQVLKCDVEQIRCAISELVQVGLESKAAFVGRKARVGKMIKLELLV